MISNLCQRAGNFLDSICNLEEKFPENRQRYDAMIRLTQIGAAVSIASVLLLIPVLSANDFLSVVSSIMIIVLSIGVLLVALYVNLYVTVKSGVLLTLLKMLLGVVLSIIIMAVLSDLFGRGIFLIGIIAALYANRRRKYLLMKNKKYIWYIAQITIGMIFLRIMGTIVPNMVIYDYLRYDYLSERDYLTIAAYMVVIMVFAYILIQIFKKERNAGTPFYEFQLKLAVIPLLMLFMLLSYLTLINHAAFSDHGIFGDMDADFLAGDSGMPHGDAAALPTSAEGVSDTHINHLPGSHTAGSFMMQPHSDGQVSLSGFSDATVQHVQPPVSSLAQMGMTQSAAGGAVFQNHAGGNIGATEIPLTQNMEVHSGEHTPSDVFKGQDSFAKGTAFDMPTSNITPTTPTAAQNFNAVQTTTPHSLHIQNPAGMTEAAITQTSPGHVVFQDPMGMHIGSATVQPGTGDVAIHGADHMIEGYYTSEGILKGVDGFTNMVVDYVGNGEYVIKAPLGNTVAHINAEGIITDPKNMTIGRLK